MDETDERLLWHAGEHTTEPEFNRAVGRALAKLRGSDDFSPNRTAQHTGLDRSFLYAVERGEKGISLFSLFRIASAAKVTAAEIVERVDAELRSDANRRTP